MPHEPARYVQLGTLIGRRTKATLPVDAFGQPARLDVIREIADRHGLVVIEDSCESLGSEYKGAKAGHGAFSHGAVFAFCPNKQITTGEGGMIVTDDDRIARLCRSMCNQGRGESGVWLSHERLGYNYRMDELSAALGVAQMSRIEENIAKRERVAAMYAGQCSATASLLPDLVRFRASSRARRRGDRKAKPAIVNIEHDTSPRRPSAGQVSASQARYRNAIVRA